MTATIFMSSVRVLLSSSSLSLANVPGSPIHLRSGEKLSERNEFSAKRTNDELQWHFDGLPTENLSEVFKFLASASFKWDEVILNLGVDVGPQASVELLPDLVRSVAAVGASIVINSYWADDIDREP